MTESREEKPSNLKIFRKQKDALEFALTDKKFLVFTNELNKDGKREYLVTDPFTMWKIHKSKPIVKRNSHELIREGTPCKIYFDLEFKQKYNPNSDGNKMVKIFIQFVCWALKSVHNISCDISNVLWLSSSSNEKFSAHLIFQLDEFAYENNVQLGYFVNYICNELENPTQPNEIEMVKKPSKEELNMLFVKNEKENITLFCDKGPVCHYQHSNYPQIDHFIKDLISNNGKGYIYKIDFYQNSILEYSTCNYRYCKNIGREHKSNNVIIVVSLKKRVYFQKCYDPECRQSNYKSKGN
ncbi:DNA-directed primase/polymerase protein-like [Centruroides sculpturatus]|uniref:DNA-directed primase/polymerase protein-like n=1 Tax=Centruroides sculpturatus TaxID=218467 RepID=UPI000C6E025E|nr:DNA-directed primase/polymerase protein-like [Centruroides sculpturatus]